MNLSTYKGTVYPWHCDHVGHMNVMWYVGKFDEATWQLFNLLGLKPGYLKAAQRGMAAVDQQISYVRELHAGAVVSVQTQLMEWKEKSLVFEHEMRNDDTNEVCARTRITAVHLDTQKRKACGFDAAIAQKALGYLSVK